MPLDERKTPQQNAAYNYKLYKAKTANRMLTELIAAAREDEAYLESVLDELSAPSVTAILPTSAASW